jgi:hypothetical protein
MMISKGLIKIVPCFLIIIIVHLCTPNLSHTQKKLESHIDIQNQFTPSGSMGDGEYGNDYIKFFGNDKTNPHSAPTSIKITYIFGPNRWGGIYWQNKPDNWGDEPGNNYAKKGFSKITFWARGETGNEIVEFKAGGIHNKKKDYHDSFEKTIGKINLTQEWKKYQIDLTELDLSSVIGGFCWVASSDYNSGERITFYLDDIFLE